VCGPWNQVQPGNLSFYSIDIDYSISIGGGGEGGVLLEGNMKPIR